MTTIASTTLLHQNREAIDRTYSKIAQYSNVSDGSQPTKEQHYYDLSPEIAGRSIDTASKIKQIENDLQTLKSYEPYIEQYNNSIINLSNLASEVRDFTVVAIGIYGKTDMLNIREQAKGYLSRMELLLNTKFDGKYLYAGSKNVPPAPNLTASNISATDSANQTITTAYYHGDQVAESICINGHKTTFGVTADNQGIAQLIGSLHYLIQSVDEKSDEVNREQIDKAATLAETAFDKINELKSQIGNAALIVKDAISLKRYTIENLQSLYDNQLNGVNDLYLIEIQKLLATSTTQMTRIVAITKKLLEMLEMSGNLLLN